MFSPFRASTGLARALFPCLIALAGPALAASNLVAPAQAAPDQIVATRPEGHAPPAWRDAGSLTALVLHLDGWLDAHGDLPRRAAPPRIRFVDPVSARALSPAHAAAHGGRLRGLYDPRSATVFLVHPWSPQDPHDVSALLHELVHHRQATSGNWYCPDAQELPAYRLQRDWLAGMGLEPQVNWIAVVIAAGCAPRDIHP